ncbi:shikimate kinase [Ferrigenium kumadai]|uniref:Shikimate kinase n=2 Tax=Ferrigenium kumadai TaxID=1682490 RepID=A0AAN1SX98_9PROT|nr:shikimate kinase [Ferrigenium kumadai]
MCGMQNSQENSVQESCRRDGNRKCRSGNLILVGMMGSGKTTMGRTLAKHLGKTFVDSDEEIQKRTGVTIPHIFDIEGEAGFRQRETAVISDLVGGENMVLATGGGAVLAEQNRAVLQQNGIVIYLKANVHDLWLRTRHDRNRPLLQTGDPYAKLTDLFQQRDPLYREVADIVIQSGKQSVHSLMLQLVGEIETYRETRQ